ncbi:NADP-dependent oxidoreductase domain-containing protein [Aspergillus multicolor]|uniref:aldo/keto reductase n=1 Tax=Aspergillus multicolor TaxID=41759 RepID=UPI003CCE47C0
MYTQRLLRPVSQASRFSLGPWSRAAIASRQISNYTGKAFTLNTGAQIPAIGCGTFQDKEQQEGAVLEALKAGVRLIDTARVKRKQKVANAEYSYDTEPFIGAAIQKSSIPRNEIFLTTKLWCNSFHPEDVESALEDSLRDLQTDYVDLFMLHYPCTFARGEDRFPKSEDGLMRMGETTYVDTWKALQEIMKRTGKIKAIGVSNFSQDEVENLIAAGMPPAVHQMEVHPFLSQKTFTTWHKTRGIHVQQFSPLGNMNSFYREVSWSNGRANRGRLLDEPVLHEIGAKYNKTPAQVALAWGVNHGRSVIPKSTIPWQIRQNVESVFVLDLEDVEKIDALNADLRFNTPDEAYRWPLYKGLDGV